MLAVRLPHVMDTQPLQSAFWPSQGRRLSFIIGFCLKYDENEMNNSLRLCMTSQDRDMCSRTRLIALVSRVIFIGDYCISSLIVIIIIKYILRMYEN